MRTISAAEKKYIEAGCLDGVRYDGRGLEDYRSISIENSIFPHVNGSCRVKIAESVDVICSIKLEVIESNLNFPDVGSLEVNVDISPSCRVMADERSLAAQGNEIADNLESVLLGSSAVDLKDFCIISGKYCWSVQIDLLIMQMDGDPLDICSIATYVALNCTKIPKVELCAGASGKMEAFEICGDLGDGTSMKTDFVPICVTLVKINDSFVVDSNLDEQDCASCILSIAVDQVGQCCGIKYLKRGTFSLDQIAEAVKKATHTASSIFVQLHEFVRTASVTTEERLYPDVPPSRAGLLIA